MAEELELLDKITFNFNPTGLRYDYLDGKQYIVAPAAMIEAGVREGSQGPLYYPEDELSRNPSVWNMKPIVVNHPEENGKNVIACTPKVIEEQGIGMMFNTTYAGKLRTEAWIDPIKAKKVDPRVMAAVDKGQIMEVSTGMHAKNDGVPGKHGDKSYVGTVRHIQPDHLAVLTDTIGAYSVASGGGLMQTNASSEEERLGENAIYNRNWSQEKRDKLAKEDFGDPAKRLYPIETQEDVNAAEHLVGKASNPEAVKQRIIKIAKRMGLKIPAAWHGSGSHETPVKNESSATESPTLSHDGIRSAIRTALRTRQKGAAAKPSDPTKTGTDSYNGGPSTPSLQGGMSDYGAGAYDPHYVEDVYHNFAIYSDGKNQLWKEGYSIDKNGTASMGGNAEQVKRVTEYRKHSDGSFVGNSYSQLSQREFSMSQTPAPAQNQPTAPVVANAITKADDSDTALSAGTGPVPAPPMLKGAEAVTMTVPEKADKLIKQGTWGEEDREWLSKLPDKAISKMLYTTTIASTPTAAAAQGGSGTTTASPVASTEKPLDLTGDSPSVPAIGPVKNEQPIYKETLVSNTMQSATVPAVTPAPAPAPVAPVVNATPPVWQPTPQQLEFMKIGEQQVVARRQSQVDAIVANSANRFNADWLKTLPSDQLEAMAALAVSNTPIANQVPNNPQAINQPHYAGAGGGGFVSVFNENRPIALKVTPLGLPSVLGGKDVKPLPADSKAN